MKAHRKFRNLYLFMDRAPQHAKTRKALNYLKTNRKTIDDGFLEAAQSSRRWRNAGEGERKTSPQCHSSHYHPEN
jgi:hypothetical protein